MISGEMTTPPELHRTAELLERYALVETVHLHGDIAEFVGQWLSYVIALRDDATKLWLFARCADRDDDLIGLIETEPDERGWRFVRRTIYSCEWDAVREIKLPLQLGECPAAITALTVIITGGACSGGIDLNGVKVPA
jgi:hypothetical protein